MLNGVRLCVQSAPAPVSPLPVVPDISQERSILKKHWHRIVLVLCDWMKRDAMGG